MASLDLAGAFNPGQLTVGSDGNGGTDIELTQNSAGLSGQVTLNSATEGTAIPSDTTVATFTDANTSDDDVTFGSGY
jgi:hypothetical protein